jgi:hypothetical protein
MESTGSLVLSRGCTFQPENQANVAMSKYRIKREPVGATFDPFLYFMFCQLLDSWLQGQISNEKNAWFPFAFLHAAQVPEWLPFFSVDKTESPNAKQSETAYTELRKSHPDATWPEHVDKPLATKGGDSNSEQHSGFAHQLARMIKELMGLKHGAHKPPAESNDNIKENVLFDLMKHYCEDLNMQSIFVTKQGYIGIGPNGLQDGDSVFLIANGNAPYVLAHIDDVLRRRAREIRNKVNSRADPVTESKLRKDLVEVEGKIGKRDGYQLVGEAYVEGVMNGEVADQVRDKMKKYSFLLGDAVNVGS